MQHSQPRQPDVHSQGSPTHLLAKVLGMLLRHRDNNRHAQGARLRPGKT